MIFITGASGFVGKSLVQQFIKEQLPFVEGSRALYGDIEKQSNWELLLKNISTIVHLAARVHVMKDDALDSLAEFRKVNVDATRNLALAAKKAGVKWFVFLSTIKVNGEQTLSCPFTSDDVPNPGDAYAISKYEAEQELLNLHEDNIFEVIIIRPPLVYGPDVKANFKKLFSLVKKKIPLPFGRIENKRSFISVLNLVDMIGHCVNNQNILSGIFLVSDDNDLSLKELILQMGVVLQQKPILLPIPVSVLKFLFFVIGRNDYSRRLFTSLQIDISKTKSQLNWKPRYSFTDTYKLDSNG